MNVLTSAARQFTRKELLLAWSNLAGLVGGVFLFLIWILNTNNLAFVWLDDLEPFWQAAYSIAIAFSSALILSGVLYFILSLSLAWSDYKHGRL